MSSWTHRMARVNGIRMHYVVQGDGPALVLLHGWPQTWYEWRHLISRLAERYTVVAPDLRGYGLTDKPLTGYDKRTMAADVLALVQSLGRGDMLLVGHDRGARVAHRLALDHPWAVRKLAFLDTIPTREALRRMDAHLVPGYWHWFFHLQPDLPELLIGSNLEAYLRYCFERWAYQRSAFDETAIAEYVRAASQPGAVRGGLSDYRATIPTDLQDDDASFEAGHRLAMPVLVLWAGTSPFHRDHPPLEIWRQYAVDVQGQPIPDCGHFLPEEQPDLTLARLLEFLAERPTP